MRITIVSPFDPHPDRADPRAAHVGGVERVLAQLSKRLARRGHDVTLVCSSEGPSGRALRDGVHVLRERRRLLVLRAPVARLARHLDGACDVVHVPATYPFVTPRWLRRARDLGVPSVLDFHFEPAPHGALGRGAAFLWRTRGPRSYRSAGAVLVRSVAYARAAASLAAVPESRWRVVPNGVDAARFRPNGAAPEDGAVLFVGRLVPYKGVHVLLRAVARLRPRPRLLLVGDGPLRPRLERYARFLGLDARFLGHVPDADLPTLYQEARVTVLPSVNGQEAFGLTLLESMACGTPVVASDLPGVAEVARIGGLLARPGDASSLARALGGALAPGTLPRGALLADAVRSRYSWEAVTDRVERVYAEVAGLPAWPPAPLPAAR